MTQVEADTPALPRTPTATPHRHSHHYRHSEISLLGASVATRLLIVAGVSAVLWVAIAWALA